MATIIVRIERSKDGAYWLNSEGLQNVLVGTGSTIEEAKEDFRLCLQDMIDSYTECGEAVPEELKDLEFEYRYDTASVLTAVSKYISLSALAKETGINASLLRQYKQGQYISAAQAQKIQSGIRSMSKRIASFTLL